MKAIDRFTLQTSERKQQLLRRELHIAGRLKHPNIINLIEVVFDERQVMLIMELARGGELYDAVKAGPMPEGAAPRPPTHENIKTRSAAAASLRTLRFMGRLSKRNGCAARACGQAASSRRLQQAMGIAGSTLLALLPWHTNAELRVSGFFSPCTVGLPAGTRRHKQQPLSELPPLPEPPPAVFRLLRTGRALFSRCDCARRSSRRCSTATAWESATGTSSWRT